MAAHKLVALLLCLSVLASSVQAAPQPAPRSTSPTFADVALSPTGGVAGRYIDVHGQGISGARATLYHGQNAVETTFTHADGTYHFAKAVPGVYRLSLDGQWQMVRVWDEATRPPSATQRLTIVQDELIVRGQTLSNSLVAQIGLGIGAAGAIAAGVAIAESQDAQREAENLRRLLKVSSP